MAATEPDRHTKGAGYYPDLLRAASLDDAVAKLAELGADGAPFAGGSWVMRAYLRNEKWKRAYVSLAGIAELSELAPPRIGALVTHARLAGLDGALGEAARAPISMPVRNVATLGGNLCAGGFAEAELATALLALDAAVHVRTAAGAQDVSIADFLATRDARPAGELVTGVTLGAAGWRSAYERLAVRGANEYPVAAVAVALDLDGGAVRGARVAVGAVEGAPRRVEAAEAALTGGPADAASAEAAGRAAAAELTAREGADAPGWYRLAVLPALVRTAVSRIAG